MGKFKLPSTYEPTTYSVRIRSIRSVIRTFVCSKTNFIRSKFYVYVLHRDFHYCNNIEIVLGTLGPTSQVTDIFCKLSWSILTPLSKSQTVIREVHYNKHPSEAPRRAPVMVAYYTINGPVRRFRSDGGLLKVSCVPHLLPLLRPIMLVSSGAGTPHLHL
jgi:hypothetical protein